VAPGRTGQAPPPIRPFVAEWPVPAEADLLHVLAGAGVAGLPSRASAWFDRASDAPEFPGHWTARFALSAAPTSVVGAFVVPGPDPTPVSGRRRMLSGATATSVTPNDPLPPAAADALYALVRARRGRRVLELGTGDGAAALMLGDALRHTGGELITVERDSARLTKARKHLQRSGLSAVVHPRLGEFQRIVPDLSGGFDMVLFDADPLERLGQLELVLPLCRRGSLLVSRGAVARAARLALYQAGIRTHPAVGPQIVIAAGDGLGLAIVL